MSAINCLPSDKGIDIHIVHDKAFEHTNGVLAVKPKESNFRNDQIQHNKI